jgi:hypothetical protein
MLMHPGTTLFSTVSECGFVRRDRPALLASQRRARHALGMAQPQAEGGVFIPSWDDEYGKPKPAGHFGPMD